MEVILLFFCISLQITNYFWDNGGYGQECVSYWVAE